MEVRRTVFWGRGRRHPRKTGRSSRPRGTSLPTDPSDPASWEDPETVLRDTPDPVEESRS